MCMRPLEHIQALHVAVAFRRGRVCSLQTWYAIGGGRAMYTNLMHGNMQALLDDAAPAAALGAVFALCRRLCALIQVRHGSSCAKPHSQALP